VAGKWQLGDGQLWQLAQVPGAKAIRQKEIIQTHTHTHTHTCTFTHNYIYTHTAHKQLYKLRKKEAAKR